MAVRRHGGARRLRPRSDRERRTQRCRRSRQRDGHLRLHLPVRDQRPHDGNRHSDPRQMSELGSYDVTLRLRRALRRVTAAVDSFGEQALFYSTSVRFIPLALRRYRTETVRLIAEMTLGTGALILIGG